jgi:hypothetical protein
MGKLSKKQVEMHDKAMQLIHSDKPLTNDQKEFILQHFDESFNHSHKNIGSFFTPYDMAQEFRWLCQGNKRIIDLCAGIGGLSYHAWWFNNYNRSKDNVEVVCVEFVEEYVEVGKRVLPEATWIKGSILDMDLMLSLGEFDKAYGNPPFGKIKTGKSETNWYGYSGNEFEYKAVAVASMIAKEGSFIIPKGSSPFSNSGYRHEVQKVGKYENFKKETGISFQPSSFSAWTETGFKHTNIDVEFVECDFDED